MNTYDYITDKINGMKAQYPSLRDKTDDYVFSALCIKASFYKSPTLFLHEEDFAEMIVDSSNDGGADILLTDPNSETSDLIIGQSKFYKDISNEQVLNAVRNNKRVKALAFNRKEKEGGSVGTHISDIWTDIYRQLRNMSYDIDEELACFKDFWTSQKNRGNKMFTQGKINGFKNLDVISAVPDIRSAVRNILDIMFEETEDKV